MAGSSEHGRRATDPETPALPDGGGHWSTVYSESDGADLNSHAMADLYDQLEAELFPTLSYEEPCAAPTYDMPDRSAWITACADE